MRLLTAAALLSVALAVAGCGGPSSPSVAHLSTGKSASLGEPGRQRFLAPKPREPPAGIDRLRQVHARQRRAQLPGPERQRRLQPSTRVQDSSIRPRSRRRRRSVASSCRRGPRLGAPPPSPQTLARFLKLRGACASTASTDFPDPRTTAPSEPVWLRHRGVERHRRSDPPVPQHDRPAVAGVHAAAAACAFPLHNH